MEAGPYLSAIYEMFRPQRHPRPDQPEIQQLKGGHKNEHDLSEM